MDVFRLREQLVRDYADYSTSFLRIRDQRVRQEVDREIAEGLLWPAPLIGLNPSFASGGWIDDLVDQRLLHEECRRIFQIKPTPDSVGQPLRLHRHQYEAVQAAMTGRNYVLTTGTGSGKSLAYIVPIVDAVLRRGSGKGIQAIVVYPMNALANSQKGELEKFLQHGYPDGQGPVTFNRYTGQESDAERQAIIAKPPDILLTNYVMLELILTRPVEQNLVKAAKGLRFLVLDELHTYRGRQGADVALLVRRTRDLLEAEHLQCVGTSATLAGAGSFEQQRREVADVATRLFGAPVQPEQVIGETLRRVTPERDGDATLAAELRAYLAAGAAPPATYADLIAHPLASWVESTFGVTTDTASGRLIRSRPRGIIGADGAAQALSQLTGVEATTCRDAIERLLLAGYTCRQPETQFPVFAFRLHQFFSPGDRVYASLEAEETRYLTVRGQQFVPGDRERVLLPLVFCRECGQDYYSVSKVTERDATTGETVVRYRPRPIFDRPDEEGEAGFLYASTTDPWPDDQTARNERLPDHWLEEHPRTGLRQPTRTYARQLPERVVLDGVARATAHGLTAHFVSTPFRFCLHCGVAYASTQRSDFAKLTSLGIEGRSTATTILCLAAIRALQAEPTLRKEAQKLLSFTDNRQDASLQAGHFNDFVETSLLRAALFHAAQEAGASGLSHDALTQAVFDALDLPFAAYAFDPTVRYRAQDDTKRALRDVLGYRLYRDLRRGWRITAPNLEQCGLLRIDYESLDDLCANEEDWRDCHSVLAGAQPATRAEVARTLLDFMRRELAIRVDYLQREVQERLRQQSNQRLVAPWALDEYERLEEGRVLLARAERDGDPPTSVYLSPRGGFGLYLRRERTFPDAQQKVTQEDTRLIIGQLLERLQLAGIVARVREPDGKVPDDVAGYQIQAAAIRWQAGDGTALLLDPIRMPRQTNAERQTNRFFTAFYRAVALTIGGIEAREHTAQVPYDDRQDREQRFREGRLPLLFCSPTMELGVDIAELNVVSLRNVPPTPANYAQRSGRAGRSGQPALVFAYCATGSPHDQYFFKRPDLMVAGAVSPPRLDLANEDLVRAHIHAIWLTETGVSLGRSLQDLLNLDGAQPSLALLTSVSDQLSRSAARTQARVRATRVLDTIAADLAATTWYDDGWLDRVLDHLLPDFDAAAERWRVLYRAAANQRDLQNRIIADASRSSLDKDKARVLRRDAEKQIDLLLDTDSRRVMQSDFYTYRYFASEGFLPGYSFPRLPLSAFIPARGRQQGREEYVQRPRFLAVSEFGPRAIIYHEGSRYRINKVILPVRDDGELPTSAVKQCAACGYLHPVVGGLAADLCERCHTPLDTPLDRLFRMQNVSTVRQDRINSDEEERLRLGFELRTGVRFVERGDRPAYRTAVVQGAAGDLARLTYADAATLWRINLGWTRRRNRQQYGFILDTERGYWARNEDDTDDDRNDDLSQRSLRVIPYVDDRRNCLLLEPLAPLSAEVLASLQAALKHAIQIVFQLEDSEIAAEPLPNRDDRRLILLYESAEGGAGVLRRLLDEPEALAGVAREALRLCHFAPDTGADLRRLPGRREDCEAACYDCLMSYSNQRDHPLLDRHVIRDFLLQLAAGQVEASPGQATRGDHLQALQRQAGSSLELAWLDFLEAGGYRLPAQAQVLLPECGTRPDFLYDGTARAAIYIDGPIHDYPERRARDEAQADCLLAQGYEVIRFGAHDDWEAIVAEHAYLFGTPVSR